MGSLILVLRAIPKAYDKAQIAKGTHYLQQGKVKEAEKLFEHLSNNNRSDAMINYYLLEAKKMNIRQQTKEIEVIFSSGNKQKVQALSKK